MDTVSDKKIARLVASKGKTRVYEMDDGHWLTARGGTVAWRNNNPGNLKFEFEGSADASVHSTRTKQEALESAQAHYHGIVALDQWGNGIFENFDSGRDAQKRLLFGESMLDKTVDELVKSYSKADYSGSTHYAHQASVIYATAKAEGYDLHDKKVKDMTSAERDALADGVARAESWKAGTIQASPPLTEAQLSETLRPQHHEPTPAHHAYRQGNHGEAVGQLQEELAALGVTSRDGHAITPDRSFGPRTKQAVEEFQRSHNLTADGIVGPATGEALKHATLQQSAMQALTLDHPQHPGHPLYQQALAGVGRLDDAQGRTADMHSYNLSGVLAVAARREGLERIDRVILSEDATRAIAVQGDFKSPLRRFADVDVVSGISTPLAKSSTGWSQLQPAAPQGIQPPTPLMPSEDLQATQSAMQR